MLALAPDGVQTWANGVGWVLAVCQTLRILSFTVTQLPASNYHCREGQATAIREMPDHWWGHVAVDLKRQVREMFPSPEPLP